MFPFHQALRFFKQTGRAVCLLPETVLKFAASFLWFNGCDGHKIRSVITPNLRTCIFKLDLEGKSRAWFNLHALMAAHNFLALPVWFTAACTGMAQAEKAIDKAMIVFNTQKAR